MSLFRVTGEAPSVSGQKPADPNPATSVLATQNLLLSQSEDNWDTSRLIERFASAPCLHQRFLQSLPDRLRILQGIVTQFLSVDDFQAQLVKSRRPFLALQVNPVQ
jgi:hypothetical protein